MKSCIIRKAELNDMHTLAQMEKDIFSDGWSQKSLADSWEQSHVYIGVAELEEQVVGYVILYTAMEEGDIARIAVKSDCRRMGIADQLMKDIFRYCHQAQVTHLLLEVREHNDNAIELYKKHGFISIGMRKNYYQEPLENGVIMENNLDISGSIFSV